MIIQTRNFGPLDIDESKVLAFPKGILGFPKSKQYILLGTTEGAVFGWLQSVDEPDVGFVVGNPFPLAQHYSFRITPGQCRDLGSDKTPRVQLLAIVNKVGNALTMNLQGPLVINMDNRIAAQFVMGDAKWNTRHTIKVLEQEVTAHATV